MNLHVLHNLSYGMYIVASQKGDNYNAQIANTVFQITSNPVWIGVSINKENLTHEYIEVSGLLGVSIIAEDAPLDFITKLGFRSGRNADKLSGLKVKVLDSGCPVVLDNSVGYLELKVAKKVDCPTHTVYMGELHQAEKLNDTPPMTYAYYRHIKHGGTPKTAPTYLREA